jgi:hypothetical protein
VLKRPATPDGEDCLSAASSAAKLWHAVKSEGKAMRAALGAAHNSGRIKNA